MLCGESLGTTGLEIHVEMTGAAAMMLRVLRVSILQGLCPKEERKKKSASQNVATALHLQRMTLALYCSTAAFNIWPRFWDVHLRQNKTVMLG
jgi:hypothetical protein